MAFPDVARVLYRRNPIELAVCQFRFPPILRIDAEIPSQFQERIRGLYPFYEPKSVVPLPLGLPPDVASIFSQSLPFGPGQKRHEFLDAKKQWTVSLDRESLALTCTKYERWEQFKEFLAPPLGALRELYAPSFYVRVGLRYRDVIRRSTLGLADFAWKDLLKPWIAGPFESPDVQDDIQRTAHQISIRLSDSRGQVLVNHGLAQEQGAGEWCYVIDSDFFYEEQTENASAIDRLDFLHIEARRCFRWCITDRLHESMHPEPLPGP